MLPTTFRFIWSSGFRNEDYFRNQLIRNKNCLWQPCLLTNRSEMNTFYRGPTIYASYQVSVHLPCSFRGEDCFTNRPIRSNNCLWRSCLLTDRDELNNRYRGPCIDAFCQVTVDLGKGFQRIRLKCEKFTDGRQLMAIAHVAIDNVN